MNLGPPEEELRGFQSWRLTTINASKDMPIGVGVTAVDVDGFPTILLRVHEGVVTQFNSIISVNQVRAHGHEIDDVPLKYGGKQRIVLHDYPR